MQSDVIWYEQDAGNGPKADTGGGVSRRFQWPHVVLFPCSFAPSYPADHAGSSLAGAKVHRSSMSFCCGRDKDLHRAEGVGLQQNTPTHGYGPYWLANDGF